MNDLAIKIIMEAMKCPELVAKTLAGEIEAAREIVAAVRGCDDRLRDLEKVHKVAVGAVETERRAIQARCTHASTTYYPDAAGGSDSYTRCDACGKDLGR